MKKVGILTMHRIHNHGSFLQAFGLKSMIESILQDGAKCEFLDWPNQEYLISNIKDPGIAPIGWKYALHCILGHKRYCLDVQIGYYSKKFILLYQNQIKKYLGVSNVPNTSTDYDVIIVGSDEVFNCTQPDAKWDGTYCFNSKLLNTNVCSYAGSMGYTDIDRLDSFGYKQIVKSALKQYKRISVRDKKSLEIIKALTNRDDISVNLDPVLMYPFEKEIVVSKDLLAQPDYILIYNYLNRINNPDFIIRLKYFAKKNKLKIISIFEFCPWADEQLVISSFEVLAYFDRAKYVVTDTYHGCVMSVKYNKKFVAFVREQNRNKLTDLLAGFNLTGQIIDDNGSFEGTFENMIDWNFVNKRISDERQRTMQYLSEILS